MTHDFLHLLYSDVRGTLDIAHLPADEQDALLRRFYTAVEARILSELDRTVAEPKVRAAVAALYRDETVTHEARFASIHNHIPNLTRLLDAELDAFRRELHTSV